MIFWSWPAGRWIMSASGVCSGRNLFQNPQAGQLIPDAGQHPARFTKRITGTRTWTKTVRETSACCTRLPVITTRTALMQEKSGDWGGFPAPKISRYLNRAPGAGHCQGIRLTGHSGFSAMEKRLEKALGLEKVVIAPCSSAGAGQAACHRLFRLHLPAGGARDAHIIGFGWGAR